MSHLKKELGALRAALAVSPDNMPLRLHLAETLCEAGYRDEAVVEYYAALKLDPNLAAAHAALGMLLYERNELTSALDHLQAAVRLDPADGRALLYLSRVESALGHHAEALMHLGAARAADPSLIAEAEPAAKPAPLSLSPTGPDDRDMDVDGAEVLSTERPAVTFDDVGGLETVKEQVRLSIIYPFQRPELYAAYGRKAGGGILMYGPPGCGKTLLARATAGEVNAEFIYVGIDDVLDMYHGESERKLHAIFETARRKAPAVLFFDEVEAVGGKRVDMRQHFLRTVVNQFLAEMDGMEGDNDRLLIIGATNAPWHVDGALMRPGRFDRVVFVPPPDYDARVAILRIHLRGRPVADPDVPRLARETNGYSGADLMGIVEAATDTALQDALRSGDVRPIASADLLDAARQMRPTVDDWMATARNYGTYANETGFYDEVMRYIKGHKHRR
ncbi:MAG: AAA family ATPase [Anaerolineae bacterium]|nr:AAA family ATPase [Anaerolineae bacterium]